MTITAITGEIGSGKSFKQLQYALYCCNRYKKKLVTNFGLNIPAVKRYAVAKKYWWVVWLCDNGQIATVDANNMDHVVELLRIPRSVVCLDEAGIFFGVRDFAKTPKSLLRDLAQSRKNGCDLIYATQFDGQVDKQFRLLTQYFIHAGGTTVYDRKLSNQRLVWKFYATFTAGKYWEWNESHKKKNSFLRTWFAAIMLEFGPLTKADSMLFDCFESFARLDEQATNTVKRREKYTSQELLKTAITSGKSSAALARHSRRQLASIKASGLPAFLYAPIISKAKRYLSGSIAPRRWRPLPTTAHPDVVSISDHHIVTADGPCCVLPIASSDKVLRSPDAKPRADPLVA